MARKVETKSIRLEKALLEELAVFLGVEFANNSDTQRVENGLRRLIISKVGPQTFSGAAIDVPAQPIQPIQPAPAQPSTGLPKRRGLTDSLE